MKTKGFEIELDLNDLTLEKGDDLVLMNFRIEGDLKNAFKELCRKEIVPNVSESLRAIIRSICVAKGYYP